MAANKHSVNYALEMRAQILCALSIAEMDTAQLAEYMMLSRSSILNHLSYLEGHGLIEHHLVRVNKRSYKQVHYSTHTVTDKIKAMQIVRYGLPNADAKNEFTLVNQLCAITGTSRTEYAIALEAQTRRIHQEGFNNHGKNHT